MSVSDSPDGDIPPLFCSGSAGARRIGDELKNDLMYCWAKIGSGGHNAAEQGSILSALFAHARGEIQPGNAVVVEHSLRKLIGIALESRGVTLVGISGGDALGKTTLAADLRRGIGARSQGLRADVLSVDAYIMDRDERGRRGLRGNDPESFRMTECEHDLRELKEGRSVRVADHDHSTGGPRTLQVAVGPCDVVIVEGSHAFHPAIFGFLDYKIFLLATPAVAKELRFVVDVTQRNYEPHEALDNVREEYRAYVDHVQPYASLADMTISVHRFWRYEVDAQSAAHS